MTTTDPAAVTRAEIDDAVQRYGGKPFADIRARYRDSRTERDFAIGMAITRARG